MALLAGGDPGPVLGRAAPRPPSPSASSAPRLAFVLAINSDRFQGGVGDHSNSPCCCCCRSPCRCCHRTVCVFLLSLSPHRVHVPVFSPQGSAAACARPTWARCGSCRAAAPMWGPCSPSSARPSTSWRGRPPSAAFGTGTARSGRPGCPPARVRVSPSLPLPRPCPSCHIRIRSGYLCRGKDEFDSPQSCPPDGNSTPYVL